MCARRSTPRSGWSSLLPLLVLVLSSSDALARRSMPWPTPVEVRIVGPEPVRVRVTNGVGMPCDSADDRPIVVGRFKPGDAIRAVALGDGCVCFQQTHAPFSDSDSDWSTATLGCTACTYNPYSHARSCLVGRFVSACLNFGPITPA